MENFVGKLDEKGCPILVESSCDSIDSDIEVKITKVLRPPRTKKRDRKTEKKKKRWTTEEHNKFMDAVEKHGKAWKRIEEAVGTKTYMQV